MEKTKWFVEVYSTDELFLIGDKEGSTDELLAKRQAYAKFIIEEVLSDAYKKGYDGVCFVFNTPYISPLVYRVFSSYFDYHYTIGYKHVFSSSAISECNKKSISSFLMGQTNKE